MKKSRTNKVISIKTYDTHPKIVAACDIDLLGKYFEEGKMQIEVKEEFYKGEIVDEKKAKEILKKFSEDYASFNFVGEKTIKIAIEIGIIKEENILRIKGIPVALALT